LARSQDEGATLDFSSKNLVEVGESGARELAQIGRGEDELDECCILRCVGWVTTVLSRRVDSVFVYPTIHPCIY
jgi:hypothetical protein